MPIWLTKPPSECIFPAMSQSQIKTARAFLYVCAVSIACALAAVAGQSTHNPTATAWTLMTDTCADRGGIRHSYAKDILSRTELARVKCGDGTNHAITRGE